VDEDLGAELANLPDIVDGWDADDLLSLDAPPGSAVVKITDSIGPAARNVGRSAAWAGDPAHARPRHRRSGHVHRGQRRRAASVRDAANLQI